MAPIKNTERVTENVCAATKVNKNTVTRIRKEYSEAEASSSKISTPRKKPRGKNIVFDSFETCALNNIMNAIYVVRKEVPTLNQILAAARKDLDFPGSKATLRRLMINNL